MKPIRKGKAAAIAAGLIVAGVILYGALSWREIAAGYYAAKLNSPDEKVRNRAILALMELGPRGISGWLQGLRAPNSAARYHSACFIGEIRPPEPSTIASLLALLNSEKATTRASAASALSQIGPEAREAIPKLIEIISDPDADVRSHAINALAYIDREQFSSYPVLLKKLNDESPKVRAHAARALSFFAASGKDIGTALPVLIKNLADSFGPARVWSARAIRAAGPAAASTIPTLIVMARGTDKTAAACALGLLGAIALNQNIGLFIEALKDSDPKIRIMAANSLGDLGPAGNEAIAALKAAADDHDEEVRNSVKVALEKIEKAVKEPDRGK